ncbi:APC membrane recruitment protein 1 isoform X2 [Cephus cinctus]|uniref:APC membrane recruitment protein 1 isoform X2 n=1 Tax=Cephus cinctus TaxID=211228 RepID=A0AAJ7RRQ0_CEPCN|nr:APC membrane recruitment protein 1 isoform X2 [Cephus cinctus]
MAMDDPSNLSFTTSISSRYSYQYLSKRDASQRRHPRFEQAQGQFDQATYFGPAVAGTIGLDWQRNNFATASTDALINHMSVAMSNHQIPSIPPGLAHIGRHGEELGDQEAKVVSEEIVVKKNKQRKPMSQSYPSRPWNREDAERALQIENEYNKTVKAQSLIIKFPDPDLNKDIVREFHSGIQNIHFQSPSGPRYCFIQMAENVNIDEAIKELEKIPFGVGHLKVERKSLRDEDNPMPEEIDPYTLYIGNLPESVNVNEVKSKFPSAARVDVGYAQKMRNTRYAFIRYNSVDESISAYKQAHDLMWDTRSIIVRFRRQRGNTCLPGESKPNLKRVKDEPGSVVHVKKEQQANCKEENKTKPAENVKSHSRLQTETNNAQNNKVSIQIQQQSVSLMPTSQSTSSLPTSIAPAKTAQEQQQQPWTSQLPQIPSASEAPPPPHPAERNTVEETIMLTEIKEEPEDYEEMEMAADVQTDEEVDDDDDEEEEDDTDDDDDDDDNEEEDDDEDDDEEMDENETLIDENKRDISVKENEPTDHLDQMFNDLENMAGDIGL